MNVEGAGLADERDGHGHLRPRFYLTDGAAPDRRTRTPSPRGILGHLSAGRACYGASDCELPTKKLQGGARRHYTREQAESVGRHGRVDVLLLHDAPAGTKLAKRLPSGTLQPYVSQAAGLGEAVARTRPKACFLGHHHQRVEAEVSGVRCIGLNAVGRSGNLVAFRLGEDACEIAGEWPA